MFITTMICLPRVRWFLAVLSLGLLASQPVQAGYEAPCHIDGCQSSDGRFVITAELIEKARTVHGPHQWRFVWKDTKTSETRTFPAQGVQGGQIYAHLFIAPDGATFALWNHVVLWTKDKSEMHGPKDIRPSLETPEYRNREEYSNRIMIYSSKDGSIIKRLRINDLIKPEEWESIGPMFNRMHWLKEYPGQDGRALNFKQTLRHGYAFYRISPDYTVLEFQVPTPRSKKVGKNPPEARTVRVSLTDGRIFAEGEEIKDRNKLPVRPWLGPDYPPGNEKESRESFLPSLDPVRIEGKFIRQPPAVGTGDK